MPGRLPGAAVIAALWLIFFTLCAQAGPSLVFEATTGQVLLEERSSEPWYPASLTKLMTAYLAFSALRAGTLKLDQRIPVSAEAVKVAPSKIGMPQGQTVTVDFALKAMLVYSANDMAVVLAEAVAGSAPKFVDIMNGAAKGLGMNGTFFANPHGLPDTRQVTTARDMGVLAWMIVNQFPEHRAYFSAPFVQVGKLKLRNRNMLLRQMPAADGLKTGFICDSGFNLVASATLGDRRYVAVVFGAKSAKARADLAQILLESGAAEAASGLSASRPKLGQLAAVPAGSQTPQNMREAVCKGINRVAMGDPKELSGWGVSFGRFKDPLTADAVLSGRLTATRLVFPGGSSGVVKMPGAKDYAAMVWSMAQPNTLTLCNYLRTRQAYCEVMPPETFAELARQAASEKPNQTRPQRKKQKQVAQPAASQ